MERKQLLFSFWVPILFSVLLLLSAGKAHSLDFAILYAGNSVVDLSVGDCGSGWRCELYRNSELAGAWENLATAATWYSDTVSAGVHRYLVKRYYWDGSNSQWVLQTTSAEKAIDSRIHSSAGNAWNVEKALVNRNIVGGPWLGGNYWSDYTGTDGNGDQIGDTAYTVSGTAAAQDSYPLKPAAYNPAIGLSRTSVAFESTATGTPSAPQELLVSSAGNMDLAIWQAAVTGTDASLFAITTDTCSHQTLLPGATCAISVTFTPDAAGEKNAVLSIPSSAAGEPEKQIPCAAA